MSENMKENLVDNELTYTNNAVDIHEKHTLLVFYITYQFFNDIIYIIYIYIYRMMIVKGKSLDI